MRSQKAGIIMGGGVPSGKQKASWIVKDLAGGVDSTSLQDQDRGWQRASQRKAESWYLGDRSEQSWLQEGSEECGKRKKPMGKAGTAPKHPQTVGGVSSETPQVQVTASLGHVPTYSVHPSCQFIPSLKEGQF